MNNIIEKPIVDRKSQKNSEELKKAKEHLDKMCSFKKLLK